MFTYLDRPCNQECVYNLIEQKFDHRSRGPPIYRSRFSCKVRQDAECAKTGCYRTMGIPKVCLCPPENYLKKNSKAPIAIIPPAVPHIKLVNEECPPCPDPCDGGNAPCEPAPCECPPEPCCCVPKCRVPRLCCNIMKPPVPSPCVGFEILRKGCKNYIHDNVVKALRMPATKPATRIVDTPKGHTYQWCDSGYPRKYVYKDTFGCVPDYIQDIKAELLRNDLQAKYDMQSKQRDIEAQIRHLEPTEHQALVCGLKKNWEATFHDFQRLPVFIDTPGKRERKHKLEEELKKLEKDIQLLERHDHIFVSETGRSFYMA